MATVAEIFRIVLRRTDVSFTDSEGVLHSGTAYVRNQLFEQIFDLLFEQRYPWLRAEQTDFYEVSSKAPVWEKFVVDAWYAHEAFTAALAACARGTPVRRVDSLHEFMLRIPNHKKAPAIFMQLMYKYDGPQLVLLDRTFPLVWHDEFADNASPSRWMGQFSVSSLARSLAELVMRDNREEVLLTKRDGTLFDGLTLFELLRDSTVPFERFTARSLVQGVKIAWRQTPADERNLWTAGVMASYSAGEPWANLPLLYLARELLKVQMFTDEAYMQVIRSVYRKNWKRPENFLEIGRYEIFSRSRSLRAPVDLIHELEIGWLSMATLEETQRFYTLNRGAEQRPLWRELLIDGTWKFLQLVGVAWVLEQEAERQTVRTPDSYASRLAFLSSWLAIQYDASFHIVDDVNKDDQQPTDEGQQLRALAKRLNSDGWLQPYVVMESDPLSTPRSGPFTQAPAPGSSGTEPSHTQNNE